MNAPLDTLPNEGEVKIIKKIRMRHECEICGEPASYKHSFLLDGARSNRASSAYGKDDCTWCEDACRFVCADHKNERKPDYGYSWCSTFPASARFAHLFLYWHERELENA